MGIDPGEPFPLYITRVRSRPLPPGDVGSLTHAGRVQRPAPTGSSFPTHLKRALALGARRVPGARSRPERPRALLGRRATPRRPPDSWVGFSPEAPGSIRAVSRGHL
jgi:hypothetical protein